MAATTEGHQFQRYRHASDPSRRRRQGDRPRQVRRRLRVSRECCTARCCAARTPTRIIKSIKIDKALKLPGVKAIVTGADLPEAAGQDRAGAASCRSTRMHLSLQHPRARQGAVRRPRDRRRRRDQPAYRRGGAAPDRGRLRSAAAGDDGRGRDERRTRRSCCRTLRNKEDGPDKQTNVAAHIQFKRGDVEGRLQRRPTTSIERELQHRDGPSGIYRAAQRRRHLQLRRPRDDLLLDPGHLRRALAQRRGARDARGQYQGRAGRDRRRLRRQDHHLPRAAVGAALEEDRPSGQADDDPRRGAARERPDFRLERSKCKMGATKDGKIIAAEVWMAYEAGALPGLAGRRRARCASSPPTTSRTS